MGNSSAIRRITLVALLAIVLGWLPPAESHAQESTGQDIDRGADHQALVALREEFTSALNERDFSRLEPLVIDDLTFISISNERVNGLAELRAYWQKLFDGSESVIESLTVAPEADEKTVFFGEAVGVAQGTSKDVFEFRLVGRRELTSRWTAVVVKTGDTWKVARVHMSANVLDNPVLDATKAGSTLTVGIALLAGLFLGLAFALLRRKRAAS